MICTSCTKKKVNVNLKIWYLFLNGRDRWWHNERLFALRNCLQSILFCFRLYTLHCFCQFALMLLFYKTVRTLQHALSWRAIISLKLLNDILSITTWQNSVQSMSINKTTCVTYYQQELAVYFHNSTSKYKTKHCDFKTVNYLTYFTQ